jgi:hypothetical protein
MEYLREYRQLVVFDCDNGQLSIFSDDLTCAALILPNFEYHIFWNDLNVPMFQKLKFSLKRFHQIYLKPNYSKQIATKPDSRLVNFIHEHIDEFEFILIVHGHDRCYKEIFQYVINVYGRHKIVLLEIIDPYSQNIYKILMQRQVEHAVSNFHPQS